MTLLPARVPASAFRNLFLILLTFSFPGLAEATISYQLSLANPGRHLFHVTITIPDVHGEVQVQMPAWNALYEVRDFASRIQQVEAFANSQSLPSEKLDKQTWKIHGDGQVNVKYAIYWDSPGPFASQLNEEHAFINPAMVFMYVPERRGENVELSFSNPYPAGWQIESPVGVGTFQAGVGWGYVLSAPSYDAFADSPIEFGLFKKFRIAGVTPPIDVIVHGDNWKQSEVEDQLRRICKYEIALMGGAPFEHYLFIYHIGKAAQGAGGGMEHANATAINLGNDAQVAGVSAHEFFHLWNVKRLRPASLEPIDYTREQFTRALWFAEGVTSTYGSYALARSGIWSKQDFYSDLARQINELESRPANKWQSAEQSSLDTWLDKYDYYNGPEFSVSYYTKGQVLGDLLDILIRDRTDNSKSLDDVLRKMNQDFAAKGKPYRDSLDVRLTAEAVAGGSFEEFFERYVAKAEPFPYDSVLAKAGLLLQKQQMQRAELGFAFERNDDGKAVVRSVDSGSAAERAGLLPGDELRQFNGENVPRSAEYWLRRMKPNNNLNLNVLRDGRPQQLSFVLGGSSATIFVLTEDPQAAPKARAIRDGLLRGKTSASASAASR